MRKEKNRGAWKNQVDKLKRGKTDKADDVQNLKLKKIGKGYIKRDLIDDFARNVLPAGRKVDGFSGGRKRLKESRKDKRKVKVK